MTQEKNNAQKPDESRELTPNGKLQRRTLLKSLVGVPVLGALGYEVIQKSAYDRQKKSAAIRELGLENIQAPRIVNKPQGSKGDLIRIGIIGYGARAVSHANGLGYMHPNDVEKRRKAGTIENWLMQEDLNVAVTGICDVFDLHAEDGLATVNNRFRAGGAETPDIPVKRYRTYREMLDDKNIDAVMIATPDHHHATITAAAARAGKHVYCEKSIALNEVELNDAYAAVKKQRDRISIGAPDYPKRNFQTGQGDNQERHPGKDYPC